MFRCSGCSVSGMLVSYSMHQYATMGHFFEIDCLFVIFRWHVLQSHNTELRGGGWQDAWANFRVGSVHRPCYKEDVPFRSEERTELQEMQQAARRLELRSEVPRVLDR